jgi:hypothetical protein
MTELLRERFVDRKNKTRKQFNNRQNDPIRVSFYDYDGRRVDDVTRKEANEIARLDPNQIFYFQDGSSTQKELNITQVNNLSINELSNKAPSCSTGPAVCGSPILSIFGGNGIGALANPIISPISSSVIAFDILNAGTNYTSPPFANLIDPCGNGSGTKLEVELENNSVNRILIKSPGDGYLPRPNGSYGGDGRVVKRPDQGLVQKSDGTYQIISQDEEPILGPGDTFIPPFFEVIIPEETLVTPTVPGVTPTVPGVTPGTLPTSGPTYPVVLEIDDIDIINPGFGYQPGDQIIVTPDRGAVLEPIIDNGRIVGVNVIKPGIGFDDFPEITTNSPTGYNFSSRPIFKVKRLNEDEGFVVPPGVTIISVVDCVGKIPIKKNFDIVPE